MKSFLIILTMLFTTTIVGQNTATWLGGTPGQETNWNEAGNWSNNRVPDALTNIVIKSENSGHQSQPTISGSVEVLSIEIQSNAMLSIDHEASLLINGEHTYTRGLQIYGGHLVNNGTIDLRQIDSDPAVLFAQLCDGVGVIVINENTHQCTGFAIVE